MLVRQNAQQGILLGEVISKTLTTQLPQNEWLQFKLTIFFFSIFCSKHIPHSQFVLELVSEFVSKLRDILNLKLFKSLIIFICLTIL